MIERKGLPRDKMSGVMAESLLEIVNLRTYFFTHLGAVRAVDDVSLSVGSKDVVGVVGESGCGKTVMARSILRLIPPTDWIWPC